MHRNVHLFLLLIGLLATLPGFSQDYFNSLSTGLEDPSTTSISFLPEDERVAEFISRSGEFTELKRIQIRRYTNSAQSKLVLATLSRNDRLHLLHVEILDFNVIPPYLDQFDGLQVLRISPANSTQFRDDPVRVVALNGSGNLLVEIEADQQTALDYMDRFFETYPEMAPNIEGFEFYALDDDLIRVNRTYESFEPFLLPKSSSVMISPVKEARIVTREGSLLTIPASAFVDQNQNPVSDSIQIDFTYFRDQLDIGLARIGMTTQLGGKAEMLQSAGMFEINASRDGSFLELAEGKNIQVELASVRDGAYNIYVLDDPNGDWSLVAEENLPMGGTTVFTPAFHEYNKMYSGFAETRSPDKLRPESTDHFASNQYVRFEPRDDTPWAKYDLSNEEEVLKLNKTYRHSAHERKSELAFMTFERQSTLHRSLRGHYCFQINELNHAIPEIRFLRKYKWHTVIPMSSSEFKTAYVRNKSYVDFRMDYDQAKELFRFVFKDIAGQFDTLYALPFPETNRHKELKPAFHQNVLADYHESFESISKKIERANASADRRYARTFRSRLEKQNTLETRAWEDVQSLMTPAEQAMSFEEWQAYFNNLWSLRQQMLIAQNATTQTVFRALSLNQMGYWNCDNPMFREARFEKVNILADGARSDYYETSALFLDFNSAYQANKNSRIDTEGDCAYLVFDENRISWITPAESREQDGRDLKTRKPFVAATDLNLDELRAELLAP